MPVYPVRVTSAHATLLVVLLVTAAACNRSQADAPGGGRPRESAAPTIKAIPITTGRAESRTVQRTVETSGSLLAWEEVVAKSEQPGTIARLRVDLGDRVEAGAVLADYDRREFELAVEQAQAAVSVASAGLRRQRDTLATLEAEVARAQSLFEWAKSEFDRSQQLFERQLIAAREVDNARNGQNVAASHLAAAKVALAQHPDQVQSAEAELKRAQAALGIAQKRLQDTTVRASIAGLVARRHISAGEFVNQNTALFTLVIANPLKYVGSVPERHAPALRIGQPVRLSVEAYPGRQFGGAVLRVAPAVDVQTRTLALEARVPNEGAVLHPGFFAKGSVLTAANATAVFVPAEAVIYVAGLSKVFVVPSGGSSATAEERLVRVGERQGPWLEIAEGVRAGEAVATSNLPALFNGAPVTVASTR
ncbi:MAG: efflux RND transporter periplasmic adaptor subunit [Candidatus Rokuibacteriota bacterium]